MSPTMQGVMVLVATLLMLMSGIPVAFGLKPKEDAEEFARAQAKQALGDVP